MIPSAHRVLARMDAHRLLPLALFIVLPALIVRVKFIPVAPDAAPLWPWPSFGDSRSWWKAVFVAGLGAWMAAHAVCRLGLGWRPRRKAFGALVLAAMTATVASALLSDFPRTAWLGYTSLYEGAIVLLAYLAATWYAAEMTESPAERLTLIRLVGCVGAIEALFGIFEGFGINFWAGATGRWLAGAGGSEGIFAFAGSNMAYGTLFQPNHYGMFMAMFTPLALGMVQAESGRGWRTFWGAACVAGLAAVVFSNSRTALAVCGLLILGCAAVAGLRALCGRRRPRAMVAVPCLAVAALLIMGVFSTGRLGGAVGGLARRLAGTFVAAPEWRLQAVELREDTIRLIDGEGVLALSRRARDAWSAAREGGGATPADVRFADAGMGWRTADLPGATRGSVSIHRDGGVILRLDGEELHYFDAGDRLYAVDHKGCLYAAQPAVSAVGLGGLERFLGGRGRTWGASLALFRHRPWFGSGPGTLAQVFPNHDMLMKQRHLDNLDEDKGHSVPVTFLVQLGGVGAAAYLLALGCIAGGRPWRHPPLGPPLALGMAGYLLCAVTNDSTVGVTPVFCVLAGLALSQTRENDAGGGAPSMPRAA